MTRTIVMTFPAALPADAHNAFTKAGRTAEEQEHL